MSISFLPPAPAPARLFPRLDRTKEASLLSCEFKKFKDLSGDFLIGECDPISDAVMKCAYGGLSEAEIASLNEETAPKLMYSDKEACTDMCRLYTTDALVTESLKCFEEQCKNYKELTDKGNAEVKAIFEKEEYPAYAPYCEKLGFAKADGKSAGAEKESGSDKKEEDSEKKDSAEGSGDAKEEDKDSGAGFIRGWKGASVVAALAFGSIFMF
ncbi:hypothetical protein BJ508DRAFT_373843 [Ascobolus immersus RN42]|uniref:Uncharacterized protein n=1 Tax=Ascobolus immersus RN42 TaxID=1160509 RepID=A0A3N4IHM2_ASCIM|nr:hypothetical protein BJ508DRAFT_373843 [Ascobolus immersus RN42]